MSWCPKCKLEFKDEFTECPDCHVALVEELTSTVQVPEIQFVTEDETQRFVAFLKYSKFENVSYEFNEEKNLYELIIEEDNVKEAFRLYHAFIIAEKEQEEEEPEVEEESDESEEAKKNSSSSVYVKKSDRYSDFSSTGIMLIILGIAGLGYVTLNAVGIIHLINSTFTYVLNAALFIGAILFGISSLNSAQKMKGQISEEEEVETKIRTWLTENITQEWVAKHTESGTSSEANILNQMNGAKEVCLKEFPEAPENMIESLIEDHFLSLDD